MNQDDDFRALAAAAMQCATGMLTTMSADALEAIELATRRGARLMLEFGPLPAFDGVTLLLVECEGQRHALGSIAVNKAPAP